VLALYRCSVRHENHIVVVTVCIAFNVPTHINSYAATQHMLVLLHCKQQYSMSCVHAQSCFVKLTTVLYVAVTCDRSGAVEQLRVHAKCLEVPLFEMGYAKDPSAVAAAALRHAKDKGHQCVLIDTAVCLRSLRHRACKLKQ
jgi:signal recognition particle GTPase